MSCPVCGDTDVRGVCARCGTDLAALLSDGGKARLSISPVRPTGASRPEKS